jgi:hypothetical protein
VHVAGVFNFLRLAEAAGWRTVFLGPSISVEKIIAAAKREQADLVGVSFCLTPITGERLLGSSLKPPMNCAQLVCVSSLHARRQ